MATELYERFTEGSDKEGKYVKIQLKAICEYATKLKEMIRPDDELPAWVQSKLAVIKSDIDEVYHYLDAIADEQGETDSFVPAENKPSDLLVDIDVKPEMVTEPDLKSFDDFEKDSEKEKEKSKDIDTELQSFDDFASGEEEEDEDEKE